MTLDAYGPDSAAGRGKADAREIRIRPGENQTQAFDRTRRERTAEKAAPIHAELAAAQAILTALDAGEVSPKLASQQVQRHLAKAQQLLRGGG